MNILTLIKHNLSSHLLAIRTKKSRQYRYCLPKSQSPTYDNLCKFLQKNGWIYTRFQYRSHLNEQHFQFYLPVTESLEFKHLLAQLVAQHCRDVMPVTYCINDQNWSLILSQIAHNHHLSNEATHLTWILKPALLNNGQHIKIFRNLNEIKQHYLNTNRLGGEHVLQQYLQPHLLKGPQKGHKYTIRMFVIMTNTGVYLYPKGYFNVALHPYPDNDFGDLRPHLTNEHLHKDEVNVVQIPTEQYKLFKPFYPQIKAIVASITTGLQQQYPQTFVSNKKRQLALFGFDFMVDSHQRVWLIEANHSPCFPTHNEHPLQQALYSDFWEEFITDFILPIATKQPVNTIQYQSFDSVGLVHV